MELLTILLPGSIDLEPTSRRTDKDGLSAALVSTAMVGANPIGVTLLKRRVTDATDSDTGILKLRSIVRGEAKHRKWQYLRVKTLDLLSDLVVFEYTHQAKCKACNGTEYIDGKECDKCHGTGYRDYSATARANYLGVSRTSYYKTWCKRREIIENLFNDMLPDCEYYARRHIFKLLRNNTIED